MQGGVPDQSESDSEQRQTSMQVDQMDLSHETRTDAGNGPNHVRKTNRHSSLRIFTTFPRNFDAQPKISYFLRPPMQRRRIGTQQILNIKLCSESKSCFWMPGAERERYCGPWCLLVTFKPRGEGLATKTKKKQKKTPNLSNRIFLARATILFSCEIDIRHSFARIDRTRINDFPRFAVITPQKKNEKDIHCREKLDFCTEKFRLTNVTEKNVLQKVALKLKVFWLQDPTVEHVHALHLFGGRGPAKIEEIDWFGSMPSWYWDQSVCCKFATWFGHSPVLHWKNNNRLPNFWFFPFLSISILDGKRNKDAIPLFHVAKSPTCCVICSV